MNKFGVGACCPSQELVSKRCVIEPGRLTPRQAACLEQRRGSYGDWVSDVPVQGPTDPGIREADCWWKDNVLDKVTDRQGAVVPRWTQSSVLCFGGRPVPGALGQPTPQTAPTAAPGLWSKLSAAEAAWIVGALGGLNAQILKAGSAPCAQWPADLQDPAKLPAAVACFQGWSNLNGKTSLPTTGVLDEPTLCALVAVTRQHAADFPAPYPGTIRCERGLSTVAKVGIGVAALAAVGGTVAIVVHQKKKKKPAAAPVASTRENARDYEDAVGTVRHFKNSTLYETGWYWQSWSEPYWVGPFQTKQRAIEDMRAQSGG